MGWIMAMFDLPVLLEEERKEATRFRNALLDDGFIMIQYSVYSRPCVSLERMKKYYERIKSYAPTTGDIRLLFFYRQTMGDEQTCLPPPENARKSPRTNRIFYGTKGHIKTEATSAIRVRPEGQ